MFAGVEIPAGTTVINRNTTDARGNRVFGKRKSIKRITRSEVESLVRMCPDLRVLELDYCYLEDYQPLSELKNLRELAITTGGNDYGGVKMTDISWVSSLKKLRYLNVCHNNISDIRAISGLYELEYLNLADNDLNDDDLSYLTGLSNLTDLDLYQLPKLTDVSPLAKLKNLTYLHLGQDVRISSVKPLIKLKKLTHLRLNSTAIRNFEYFSEFERLECLDLSYSKSNVSALYDLASCPKLWAVAYTDAPNDVRSAFSDMNRYYGAHITLFNQWSDITSGSAETTDIWTAIDRSGLTRYLGKTYREVKAEAGTLKEVYRPEDIFSYEFIFNGTSGVTFSFDTDFKDAYAAGYDFFFNTYSGEIEEKFLKGTERCIGVSASNLTKYGCRDSLTYRDIGATVQRYGNDEDRWIAVVTRNGYTFSFSCDAYGNLYPDRVFWICKR